MRKKTLVELMQERASKSVDTNAYTDSPMPKSNNINTNLNIFNNQNDIFSIVMNKAQDIFRKTTNNSFENNFIQSPINNNMPLVNNLVSNSKDPIKNMPITNTEQEERLSKINKKLRDEKDVSKRIALQKEKNEIEKELDKNYKSNIKETASNIGKNIEYSAMKFDAGILSGITGIGQGALTDFSNNIRKGQEQSTLENITDSINHIMRPSTAISDAVENTKAIFENKNMSNTEKAISAVSNAINSLPIVQQINDIQKVAGSMLPQESDKVVLEANNQISKPSEKLNEMLNSKSQENSEITNYVGDAMQSVGNMLPSMATTMITGNPSIGLGVMGYSAKGQSTQEALSKGADLQQAINIGNTKGMIEIGTEMLTGGVNIFGKGALDEIIEKGIDKKVKNEVANFLIKKGLDIPGEILEETISDVLGTLIDKGTVDPETSYSLKDWKDTAITTMLSTVILNALTGGYGKTAYNQNKLELQNATNNDLIEKSKMRPSTIENKEVSQNVQQTTQIEPKVAQNGDTELMIETGEFKNKGMPLSEENYQKELNRRKNYQYEATENEKINTLRNDMSKYWNNTNETKALGEVFEKVIIDKNYNIKLDDTITNKKGESVNAKITTLENGEVEITINPNSKNIGEFLLTHELTHAIGTDNMKKLVLDYAKKNTDINDKLNELLKSYDTTEINDEVLADISAQVLGNQEFIKSLTLENTQESKNIIKTIYESIKKLLNNLTSEGRYRNFVSELEKQWREAYRTQDNNLNNESRYKILTNEKNQKYIKADRQVITGNNPKEWQKQTREYINNAIRNGKDVNVITDSGDILTITKDTAGKAQFRNEVIRKDGIRTTLSNEELLTKLTAETHIDELARVSTKINDKPIPDSKNHKFAKDGFDYRRAYFEDFDGQYYKITMSVGKNGNINTIYNIGRLDNMSKKNRSKSSVTAQRPLSQKTNKEEITSINSITNSDENVNITKYSMQLKDNNAVDNKGKKLSKEQQEYFKDSKVRDEKGNLLEIYHTTTDRVPQFNEFNPVGTPGYKFGNTVVNYFTDSKKMSGSYADSNYKVANTKKITNTKEVKSYLDSLSKDKFTFDLKEKSDGSYSVERIPNLNENSLYFNLKNDLENLKTIDKETYNKLVDRAILFTNPYEMFENTKDSKTDEFIYDFYNKYGEKTAGETARDIKDYILNEIDRSKVLFNNENDLYRNLIQKMQKEFPKYTGTSNLQYEGYANITNPYVVDAENRTWNKIAQEINEDGIKYLDMLNKLKENELDIKIKEIFDIAKENRDKAMKKFVSATNEYSESNLLSMLGSIANYGNLESYIEEKKYFDMFDRQEYNKDLDKIKSLSYEGESLYDIALNLYKSDFSNTTNKKINNLIEENPKMKKLGYSYLDYKNLYDNGMTEDRITALNTKKLTTNDVVKQVIEMNNNGANYDGVIIKNTIDYGGDAESITPANLYVTFNSNQFKASDNLNPTQDTDIRYSQTENKWQEYLEENFDAEGTRTKLEDIKISEESSVSEEYTPSKKAKNYEKRQRNTFKKNLASTMGISPYTNNNRTLLDSAIDNIREIYNEKGKVSTEQREKIFKELYNGLIKQDVEFYNENKELKNTIRTTKLYVPLKTKVDFANYEEFRRGSIGSVTLTSDNNALPIDSFYRELNKTNADLFPDSITVPSNQLKKIVEVSKNIKKSERNLSAYNDETMSVEYEKFAKNEFNMGIDKLLKQFGYVDTYNEQRAKETAPKEYVRPDVQEIRFIYDNKNKFQKEVEKNERTLLLTNKEKEWVNILLKGNVEIDEIPSGLNKNAIIKSYMARQQLEYVNEQLKQYKQDKKQELRDNANSLLSNIKNWKDKSAGWKYARETATRNMYDIMDKESAERINKEIFDKVISNTAEQTRFINEHVQKIEDLKIDTKRKYDWIEKDRKGQKIYDGKISEAEIAQLYLEKKIDIEDLEKYGVNTKRIQKISDTYRDILNSAFSKMDDIYIEFGYAPIERRKNYFPHFMDNQPDTLMSKIANKLGVAVSQDELPTDIAGRTENFKPR